MDITEDIDRHDLKNALQLHPPTRHCCEKRNVSLPYSRTAAVDVDVDDNHHDSNNYSLTHSPHGLPSLLGIIAHLFSSAMLVER